MKRIILSLYLIFTAVVTTFNIACVAEIRGPRWHYDHDYNDDWRAHHPWHEDRQDWEH